METIQTKNEIFSAQDLLIRVLRDGEWIPIDGPTTCKNYEWAIPSDLKTEIAEYIERQRDHKI